ncbi:hypothetical protein K438DRAFT_1943978 [Mycena galopus ATCC 62051]|nr:hypothetical protein K438DRAFT_1943978 [Mycena galopus ATCC 62051]
MSRRVQQGRVSIAPGVGVVLVSSIGGESSVGAGEQMSGTRGGERAREDVSSASSAGSGECCSLYAWLGWGKSGDEPRLQTPSFTVTLHLLMHLTERRNAGDDDEGRAEWRASSSWNRCAGVQVEREGSIQSHATRPAYPEAQKLKVNANWGGTSDWQVDLDAQVCPAQGRCPREDGQIH